MPIYKGNTKIVKIYKGSIQIVKRYKGTDLIYSASRLPSAFQEVEYIESSETQWVDIQYLPNSTTELYIKYTRMPNSLSAFTDLFGCEKNTIAYTVAGRFVQYNNYQEYIRILSSSANFIVANHNSNTKYAELFIDNNNATLIDTDVNNVQYTYTTTYTPEASSLDISMYLFARNQNGTAYRPAKIRLYSCKIYDNNVLVRDFVPCYRKADNEIGLYDLVNGVFYTNAGTGTFAKGGNV